MKLVRTSTTALIVRAGFVTLAGVLLFGNATMAGPGGDVAAKAGSGVRHTAVTPKNIALGVATPLTLTFDAATVADARAEVRAPLGMTVTRADGSAVGVIELAVGRPTVVDLLVTAQYDGMQYLDVDTRQNARRSVRSVPLGVGSGVMKKLESSGRVETMSDGRRVKVMQGETR